MTTGSVLDALRTYRAIFRGSGLFVVRRGRQPPTSELPFSNATVWFPWNVDDVQSQSLPRTSSRRWILWVTLVLTGLAVAFAFRCGLFNIGGQGQYLAGTIGAVIARDRATARGRSSRPWLLILDGDPRRDACGCDGSQGIAGFLKGTVGAHEVITTIMLNWIVIWVGSYLFGLGGPLQTESAGNIRHCSLLGRHPRRRRSYTVFWGDPLLQGLHIGLFIALRRRSSSTR